MKKLLFGCILLLDILSAGVLSSGNGRYVLGQISEFRADRFLLDTETGRVWQIVRTEDNNTVFSRVPFDDSFGIKYSYMPEDTAGAKQLEDIINKSRVQEYGLIPQEEKQTDNIKQNQKKKK